MADDELRMRLRPSRARSQDSAQAARRLSAALARARRKGGTKPLGARTRSNLHARHSLNSPLLQRSLVKVQYVASRSPGGWRAHGHYLGREGAQREGERGRGFDQGGDGIALDARLDSWQKSGDRRMWKLILSPEQAQRLDLREHTRALLGAMENDLGTRLEWVAIDHHNTTHPHVHVAIRGRHEDGRVLSIPAPYIREGIRARSQEFATRSLGYRTPHDREIARERAIGAPHFGELDAILERRANEQRSIDFDGPVPAHAREQSLRLQLIGRLQFLELTGLASRTGSRTWQLSEHHRPALRQMQLLRDVQKSVARGEVMLSDPDAAQALISLRPGEVMRGRVAGVTVADVEERSFLVLEATDGRVVLIAETAEIERRRLEGVLGRGAIATFTGRVTDRDGSAKPWIDVHAHGSLDEMERAPEASTVLDVVALERGAAGEPSAPNPSLRGFAARWESALAKRAAVLEKARVLERDSLGPARPTEGAINQVRLRMQLRDRIPIRLAEIERVFAKPVREASQALSSSHSGQLVAYAEDDRGQRYAVIDSGSALRPVPTERRDLALGTRVEGRLWAARYYPEAGEQERKRGLYWKIDELDREHDRGRSR